MALTRSDSVGQRRILEIDDSRCYKWNPNNQQSVNDLIEAQVVLDQDSCNHKKQVEICGKIERTDHATNFLSHLKTKQANGTGQSCERVEENPVVRKGYGVPNIATCDFWAFVKVGTWLSAKR